MLPRQARLQVPRGEPLPRRTLGPGGSHGHHEGRRAGRRADAKPATRKIAAVSSQDVADLLSDAEAVMEVLNLKLADHSRHQELIRIAEWALIRKRQVTGQYVTPYQEKPTIPHPSNGFIHACREDIRKGGTTAAMQKMWDRAGTAGQAGPLETRRLWSAWRVLPVVP